MPNKFISNSDLWHAIVKRGLMLFPIILILMINVSPYTTAGILHSETAGGQILAYASSGEVSAETAPVIGLDTSVAEQENLLGLTKLLAPAAASLGGICEDDNSIGCTDTQPCPTGNCIYPPVGGAVLSGQECMDDLFGGGLSCNSISMDSAIVSSLTVDDGCTYVGDTATISIVVEFTSNATSLYDLSIYIAEDGGDALTGKCSIATMPTNPEPPWVDLDGGSDTCGDITKTASPLYNYIQEITIACIDADSDGEADVNYGMSWRNSATYLCTSPTDAFPSQSSKCIGEALPGIPLTVPGRIDVTKVTLDGDGNPVPSSHVFNFSLTGSGVGLPDNFALKSIDSPHESPPLTPDQTYNLTEAFPSPWILVSAICTSPSETVDLSISGGNLTVNNGEVFDCVFTNQIPTASSLVSFATDFHSPTVTQVSWMTALEDGLESFILFSAANSADFSSAQLVESFVPHGAFLPYTYVDGGIQAGEIRYYWLEARYQDGSNMLYGPIKSGYINRLYLPLNLTGVRPE